MVRRFAVLVLGLMILSGFARGEEKAEKDKAPKAPLPRAESVEWDVDAFEDAAAFKLIKREVKTGQVVWVLENKSDLLNGLLYTFVAEFFDEDGVKLMSAEVKCEQFPVNWREGERNRVILELPRAEKWKNATKVVIKSR